MSQYTEFFVDKAIELDNSDDNYEKDLLEAASMFRGFNEALSIFIKEHGYTGDLADIAAKAKFLRERFREANVKPHRDFKEFFDIDKPDKKYPRETAYRICFALGLDVNETNDFFRRVQLERSFDCHTIDEAVYYFCIKNCLTYSEARDILSQITIPKKIKALPALEILYTGTIFEHIDSLDDKEQLILYIKNNIESFRYNNATAIKYIQKLWDEISKEDGLAVKEGTIIERSNRYVDKRRNGITDTRSSKVIAEEVRYQEQIVKPEDYVVADSGASTWTIFSQIIGLRNYMEHEYATKYDRSLASVLTENALLPLNASYSFPSQHSIDRILRGELVDNEMIRKMLIFLVFYTHWAKIIIKNNDALYSARYPDPERCLDTINGRLLDAGYPELYPGNPYDWLFIWSLNAERPLEAFRNYLGEVFTIKEEQDDSQE